MYIITERPTDWIGYLMCVKEAETSTNEKKEIEMEKEKGSKQATPVYTTCRKSLAGGQGH